MSSVSDWERKRTLDKMFQHVPPHLRSEYLERIEKEKLSLKKVDEVVTGQLGMITPRPMMVDRLPGTEVRPDLGLSATTSPASTDGHTHTAYYDEAGNGYTSEDKDHTHVVRSFVVGGSQTPHGTHSHEHPGVLSRPERTAGSEFKPYYGIL